jgi:hypothetical protein
MAGPAKKARWVGPHPPSSTVPLPHRGRLKQDPRKRPVGLDLIHRLRATDGALLLVPVGASPEGKAYLAMKLNEGAPHFWRVVLEYMDIISSCFYRVN